METAAIDWPGIDTVLLDMDGTLLDLRFDNWFWQDLIPERYAALRGMHPFEARAELEPRFRAIRGTLQWYCIDHWSRELGLDIALIKRGFDARRQVGYLPGAEDFLVRLRAMGKRTVLVTNSHPTAFAIKDEQIGLKAHFDACYCTHGFDAPKEHADFWPRFQAAEPFSAGRTLFVDDSLPVLDAARAFGVGWLRAVRFPDTGQPAQSTGAYSAIDRVADLLP
jgi:putative hydrolase of the HAD superfamily